MTYNPMSSTPNPLANETVTFIQHQLPGFEDGVYQLTLSQVVNDANNNPISGDSMTQKYTFAVQGDRFSLSDSSTLVDSVFPADNDSGEFTTVLPHVVFTKTTFPWTRDPYTPKVGLAAQPDVATWLAVLLLDEDDPLPSLAPVAATIGDLFTPALNPDSTLGGNYSYFYNAQNTDLDPGESLADAIQVLDIPLSFFWQIAPTITDLPLMAHIRQVNLLTKATMPGTNGPGVPLGTYSVVFGNRLPQTGKKTYAYLVSLEELEAFLPNDSGGPQAGNTFSGSASLRLAVLTSWTFYSTGESATFVNQLLSLNGRTDPNGADATNTNLRLPYSGSNTTIADALEMGFVPLNTNLRTGEKTVSWYRGPLVPYPVEESLKTPLESADQANRFDPTTGLFDQSYGSAWTIGRMLALQDTGFSTSLYNWKTGLSQQVVDSIENQILNSTFQSVLDTGPIPFALAGAERVTASRLLLHKTLQALARKD